MSKQTETAEILFIAEGLDSQDFKDDFKEVFEENFYCKIIITNDAYTALEKMEEINFALIILGIRMSKIEDYENAAEILTSMDQMIGKDYKPLNLGLGLVKWMKAQDNWLKDVPVIILTHSIEYQEEFEKLGVTALLEKNFSFDEPDNPLFAEIEKCGFTRIEKKKK